MSNKITLNLVDLRETQMHTPGKDFHIDSATNTVDYASGTTLDEKTVRPLCQNVRFHVKFRSPKKGESF